MAKESAPSQIALEEAKITVIPTLVESFKPSKSGEMAKKTGVVAAVCLFFLYQTITPFMKIACEHFKGKLSIVCYPIQRCTCRFRSVIMRPWNCLTSVIVWPWNHLTSFIMGTWIIRRLSIPWLQSSNDSSSDNQHCHQGQLSSSRLSVDNVPPSRPPCPRLPNIGSTCFFNSTLQVLLTVKDQLLLHFEQAITGCTHEILYQSKTQSIKVTVSFADKPMTLAFLEFLKAVKDEENISIKLRQLHSKIGERYNRFSSFNQQDSEEVLRCLLDGIRMEEIEAVREEVTSKLKGHSAKGSENEAILKECLRATFKLKTLVDKIFGGSCVNTVICRECFHPLQLIEPFLDLSVPMPDKNEPVSQSLESPKNAAVCPMLLRALLEEYKMFKSLEENAGFSPSINSLEHCLKLFTALDILDEDNKFICDQCTEEKKKQEGNDEEYAECLVSKQLLIHELPPILILHMKRFHLGQRVTKNNNHIEFPDTLDVAPFCSDKVKEGKTEYELFGVVQHSGSLQGGHYVAFVKYKNRCFKPFGNKKEIWDGGESGYASDKVASNTDDNKTDTWCYTSDSYVSFADEKHVHDSQAYLLLYVQHN